MSKPIKILFISGPLNAGGAERVLLDVLNNLDSTKYQVDLALIIGQGTLLDQIPTHVNVIPIWPAYNWSFRFALLMSVRFNVDYFLRRKLTAHLEDNYDVIVSCLEGLPLKVHHVLSYSAKNLTWVHTDLNNFRYTEKLFNKENEASVYNKLDKIIFVSTKARNEFFKRFETITENKAFVLNNPIDIKKIRDHATAIDVNKKNKIVLVGRLTQPKRIDRAIGALAKLRENQIDCELLIVGGGELQQELQALATRLNVNNFVEFTGYVSNPYPYIKSANVLVSTSDFEGFGLVLVEAMTLGVPVISTKTAGPSEILNNNTYGLLCDNHIESIYESLHLMLTNENLRQEYISKGLLRAEDFDVSHTIMSFDKLIKEVVV